MYQHAKNFKFFIARSKPDEGTPQTRELEIGRVFAKITKPMPKVI